MTIHLQKLSVGTETIETLQAWQKSFVARRVKNGEPALHQHVTRMTPKQREAILDGGSIYWIIKGQMQCRNKILDLEEVRTSDGRKACAIIMDPTLIATVPVPRRPFQGWRYLKVEDAPADIADLGTAADLPPEMRSKLVNLGAW